LGNLIASISAARIVEETIDPGTAKRRLSAYLAMILSALTSSFFAIGAALFAFCRYSNLFLTNWLKLRLCDKFSEKLRQIIIRKLPDITHTEAQMIKQLGWTCTVMSVLAALAGCEINTDNKNVIKASEKIASEKRNVAMFDAVSNTTPFDLQITAEGNAGVEVVGADNLIAEVETVVEGTTLIVRNKQNKGLHFSWKHTPLTIKISLPELLRVTNAGSGDMKVLKIHGDKLLIKSDGPGDIETSGSVGELTVRSSGSGDLDLAQLSSKQALLDMNGPGDVRMSVVSQSLVANLSGSGDLAVDALQAERVSISINGPGSASFNGVIKSLQADLNGSGDLNIDRLQAELATLNVKGPGDVELSGTTRQLTIAASGSGDIHLDRLQAGNADIISSGPGNISIAKLSGQLTARLSGSGDLQADLSNANLLDLSSKGPGNMTLKGSAKSLKAQISGVGDLHARDLLLEYASVKVTGPGQAEVNVKASAHTQAASRLVKIDRSGVIE
jgi:hypothetical protein